MDKGCYESGVWRLASKDRIACRSRDAFAVATMPVRCQNYDEVDHHRGAFLGVLPDMSRKHADSAGGENGSGDDHSRKDTPGVHRPDPHMIVVHFAHNVDVWEREYAHKLAGSKRA